MFSRIFEMHPLGLVRFKGGAFVGVRWRYSPCCEGRRAFPIGGAPLLFDHLGQLRPAPARPAGQQPQQLGYGQATARRRPARLAARAAGERCANAANAANAARRVG